MFEKWLNKDYINKNLKPISLIIMAIFVLCAWLVQNNEKVDSDMNSKSTAEAVDTYIPSGFVLVPIEVQNLNALDSIVGQYGIVDLYLPDSAQPLIKGVRLIRSPKDPGQFAVLVNDDYSQKIVKHSNKPFQIAVQNPAHKSALIKNNSNKSRIQWED